MVPIVALFGNSQKLKENALHSWYSLYGKCLVDLPRKTLFIAYKEMKFYLHKFCPVSLSMSTEVLQCIRLPRILTVKDVLMGILKRDLLGMTVVL